MSKKICYKCGITAPAFASFKGWGEYRRNLYCPEHLKAAKDEYEAQRKKEMAELAAKIVQLEDVNPVEASALLNHVHIDYAVLLEARRKHTSKKNLVPGALIAIINRVFDGIQKEQQITMTDGEILRDLIAFPMETAPKAVSHFSPDRFELLIDFLAGIISSCTLIINEPDLTAQSIKMPDGNFTPEEIKEALDTIQGLCILVVDKLLITPGFKLSIDRKQFYAWLLALLHTPHGPDVSTALNKLRPKLI